MNNPAHEAASPAATDEPDTDIHIEVVRSTEGFDALSTQWRRLHDLCETTAFQSYEWNRAWWRHFGEGASRLRLNIVVARSGTEIVAIAPFVIETTRVLGMIPIRVLSFIGTGVSDFLNLLVLPELEGPVCRLISGYLAGVRAYDVLSLVDLPGHSDIYRRLYDTLLAVGFEGSLTQCATCPRTLLLETWPATLATFSSSHRKRINYADRKLKKDFAVSVQRVQHSEEVGPALDEFIQMHQRRWIAAGQRGALADDRVVRFHHEVAPAFHARGWLVLTFLVLNGKRVMSSYAFKVRRHLAFYLSGSCNVERAQSLSPGLLLQAYCMQDMIREGVTVYDFLRGTERYKYVLGAVDVPNWRLEMTRAKSWIARAKYRARLKHRRLVALLKRLRASRRIKPAPTPADLSASKVS